MSTFVLDESQESFIKSESKNIRLLAPAGAGKTSSLLYRCKYIAEKSKYRQRFQIITFTRIARDELVSRIKEQVIFQDLSGVVNVNTLNSWGNRRVKEYFKYAKLINDNSSFYYLVKNSLQPVWSKYDHINNIIVNNRNPKLNSRIVEFIDEFKSFGFNHRLIQDFKEFEKHWLFLINEVKLKNKLNRFVAELMDLDWIDKNSQEDSIHLVYRLFVPFWIDAVSKMANESVMTLEDQKYWAWLMLMELIEKGHNMGGGTIHHLLIDEFQDINPLDLLLLKAIAELNKSDIVIVGDDDQAIFEWRGATPFFILNPEKAFEREFSTYILKNNYRCPYNIVDHSQKLIQFNKNRVRKEVVSINQNEAVIKIVFADDFSDSVEKTAELVKKLCENEYIKNIALIGRKRSQIIPYQILFAGDNIPFFAAEDLQIFLSSAFSHLKNILERCNLPEQPNHHAVDDILDMCEQFYRYPLNKKEYLELKKHLVTQKPKTLFEAIQALRSYTQPLKKVKDATKKMADAIEKLTGDLSVSEKIDTISGLFDGLKQDYGKSQEDIFYVDPPFYYLSKFAERYQRDVDRFIGDLQKAMDSLAIIPSDEDESISNEYLNSRIYLMTALRAKGKEFDAVIILDAVDSIWPNIFAKEENEFEQERRLFYVAMTRVKKYLGFVFSSSTEKTASYVSRYLLESEIIRKD
jgi:DNA helicase II / ATP-dependent DNA helicase PcrA